VTLTIGSVCTGIGGLDLGLEWAGLGPVLWQVEPDPTCRAILARHWPHVDRSVRHVQAVPAAARSGRLARVDILVGGFPCQDISQANPNGAGLDGERSGLFWWVLDCIDALHPRAVVLENVGRLARRGLDVVVAELHARGFTVECTRLQAADVGAPHERERVFFVAYSDVRRREVERLAEPAGERGARGNEPLRCDGEGSAGRAAPEPGMGRAPDRLSARLDDYPWPAARGLAQRAHEPARVVEHYPGRREQLRALGNAVMPQCGYVVGRRLIERHTE
jgi:DNA (cytosine-5)-methyltransferase 1